MASSRYLSTTNVASATVIPRTFISGLMLSARFMPRLLLMVALVCLGFGVSKITRSDTGREADRIPICTLRFPLESASAVISPVVSMLIT